MEAPRREIVLPRAAYMVAAILLGGYVVYWLRDVLTPIFLAFSIAYILDPVVDWLEAVDLVLLQRSVLSRASEPFPTPLGTLDALHLATALLWREQSGKDLVMATHDEGLALAARAFGLETLGA